MAKIYFEKSVAKSKKLLPKKETISFLLNFSKALTIQKKGNLVFEIVNN